MEAPSDAEGTSSSVLGSGHCGDLPIGIWGAGFWTPFLKWAGWMLEIYGVGKLWGSLLPSVCSYCKAVLLNSDFSLSLCLTLPFFHLCPAPITPLHLSELEGEAGADSEEGKKGFFCPGSLSCGCSSLRAPRMPWSGPGVLNAWVPPNDGEALGWHMASGQSALHYPSAACSCWVVLLSSLMKL